MQALAQRGSHSKLCCVHAGILFGARACCSRGRGPARSADSARSAARDAHAADGNGAGLRDRLERRPSDPHAAGMPRSVPHHPVPRDSALYHALHASSQARSVQFPLLFRIKS